MKPLILVAGLVGLSTPVFAGNPEPVPMDLPVAAPAPVVSYGGDWTGAYGGLSIGSLDVDGTGAADGRDGTLGVHLGYDYDFGQFVLGGELEYDAADVNLGGAATVDSVARLKLRGGYDMGNTLLYATAGVAEVDTSIGSETGPFGGIGVAYQINDSYYVGGELLRHRFDNIGGTGVAADATSLSIRAGLRF